MLAQRNSENELICGLVSISDRASRGEYADEGIPALEAWLQDAITTPVQFHTRLIADDRYTIEETLRELVDRVGCDLVFTTGGTGPARRDVTPEATLAVATRELPGFAEQMRRIKGVRVAVLIRQDPGNRCKLSLRSSGSDDVRSVAALFGGGGHLNAAGATIDDADMDAVTRQTIKAIQDITFGAGKEEKR